MIPGPEVLEETTKRYQERTVERAERLTLIKKGEFLRADSPERVEKFLQRRGYDPGAAEFLLRTKRPMMAAESLATEPTVGEIGLERILGVNNLMGIAFLGRGLAAARTVARIRMGDASGRVVGYGTGFLVSPRLLLTNHHVLGDPGRAQFSQAEFDYETRVDGTVAPSTLFTLLPGELHIADPHLDYALVAVAPTDANGRELRTYGWNPLIEDEGKTVVSQWVNIIQHPNGEPKQLALRENQVIDILTDFLHYQTDTSPGSSGSPVFSDQWEVVALHHSGVPKRDEKGNILALDGRPWRPGMGEHRVRWEANEGARVSRLVAHLKSQAMTLAQRRLLDEIFSPPPPGERERRRDEVVAPIGTPRLRGEQDGTASWIIPITVSVKVGDAPKVESEQPPVPLPAPAPPRPPADLHARTSEEAVLAAAKEAFSRRPDVLRVRLGYKFVDGWITKQRAIVVTVHEKRPRAALKETGTRALPSVFEGFPVDVTNPSVEDLIALSRGPRAVEALRTAEAVIGEEIVYKPLPSVPLTPVTASMRVVAHVSPDAGWEQLSGFLGGVQKSLTVGMYDFGAQHILDAVRKAAKKQNFDVLTLVMQAGESLGGGTKEHDLEDKEVVDDLTSSLKKHFRNAWVRIGPKNGWVGYSYHIKVAVRDSMAFWLSSGNWQSSNQPKAVPYSETPPQGSWLNRYNREWHVVVEHAALASTFERYLEHDYRNNSGAAVEEALVLPDLLIPEGVFAPLALERARRIEYFAPFDETRSFTVQPLLTPDNYAKEVLPLLEKAHEQILFQNQTFNAPREKQDELGALADVLLEKQRQGLDVRIIFRDFNGRTRENLEALQDLGFKMDAIKVQPNCHTKGIVVDEKRVLLGSHNWSQAGVTINRDASLLFDDEPLAKYFAQIFAYDWENLASQRLSGEEFAVALIDHEKPTPENMVRVSWKEYWEML